MLKKIFTALVLFSVSIGFSATITVNSQASFDSAHNSAASGDIIKWSSGTFSNIYMNITKSNITVTAVTLGEVIFNGNSRVTMSGNSINFSGFQYKNGNIGTNNVISISGSNTIVSDINISGYTSYKYLIIQNACQYVTVKYCNFENRINTPDQNILSILVGTNPCYHKIQYCSFKNFVGSNYGGDAGVEPIRIGVSTTAANQSRSIVEYCYFTKCDGDGEIISHKATQCIYRYNTFMDNPYGELVLRHGDQAIVYGNFFIKNKGGVRVQEGKNHILYNNYFNELADRSIFIPADDTDRVENVLVAFNTIVKSAYVILGSNNPTYDPINITLANNIFFESTKGSLFINATGTETWIGNIANGTLGITPPSSGITAINPNLSLNPEGYYSLAAASPAINAAQSMSLPLSTIPNLTYDHEIKLDIIGTTRPSLITSKDVGCEEYDASATIQPYVTEKNTGPRYLMPPLSTQNFIKTIGSDIIIYPNPTIEDSLNIEFNLNQEINLDVELYDLNGKLINTIINNQSFEIGFHSLSHEVNISSGIYMIQITAKDKTGNVKATKVEKLIKK
ncbi:chondroitinase-B domain-containing protein [Flavobacterium sp. NG2]|uniref:chondroitinase-B domain-containing protein n=1 Tax=Flavobacterium sp. NG2 TaxID=3097547 RepID=UPI002A7F995C|nr:chondroitinase-B domain-containing protein [Flavobacterium sp. NG2]WPR70909.1 chondroitinase-B domain-containing protein [Flavobacterium sp. NG2]